MKLHPAKNMFFSVDGLHFKQILHTNLIDETKPKIKIDKWLMQTVAKLGGNDVIALHNVIKAMSNKNGGSHVDKQLDEINFYAIEMLGEQYIITIAKYILKQCNIDLENVYLKQEITIHNRSIYDRNKTD